MTDQPNAAFAAVLARKRELDSKTFNLAAWIESKTTPTPAPIVRAVRVVHARPRGAGRPAAAPARAVRATRAGPDDDDGEPEPPGLTLRRHPQYGAVSPALAELLDRLDDRPEPIVADRGAPLLPGLGPLAAGLVGVGEQLAHPRCERCGRGAPREIAYSAKHDAWLCARCHARPVQLTLWPGEKP